MTAVGGAKEKPVTGYCPKRSFASTGNLPSD